jgi:hypothetical protein
VRTRPLIALAAAAALALPASAHVATASQAIAALNAQRTANGIPGGIVENPDWTKGCANHNAYMAANPDQWSVNPHDEDSSKPGYTPEGQFAARNAVLASGDGNFDAADKNPWESAPIHLMQLLGPALSSTGYADHPGACMVTWPGYQRSAPEPVVYAYPGDGATIYTHEVAYEQPFTPGEFVGLPAGADTGPYIYVLVHSGTMGGRGKITAASLTGPDGAVEVRSVDNSTENDKGSLGPYLPAGGMVIPVKPLKPGTTYSASVTFVTFGNATLTKSWSFKTAGTASTPDGGDPGGGDPGGGGGGESAACTKSRSSLAKAQAAYKKASKAYKKAKTAERLKALKAAKARVKKSKKSVAKNCG